MKLHIIPVYFDIQCCKECGIYDHIYIFGKHRKYDFNLNDDDLDTDYIDATLRSADPLTACRRLDIKYTDYKFIPLYLYDHGGVLLQLYKSCRFDSGLYGVIAIKKSFVKETCNSKYATHKNAMKFITEFIDRINQSLTDCDYYNVLNDEFECIDFVDPDELESYILNMRKKGHIIITENNYYNY